MSCSDQLFLDPHDDEISWIGFTDWSSVVSSIQEHTYVGVDAVEFDLTGVVEKEVRRAFEADATQSG